MCAHGRGTGTGTQLASVSSRAAHRRASSLRHVCGDELAQDGAEDMRIVARVRLGGGRFARWALLVEVDEEHLEAGGRRRVASARRRRAAGVRPCSAPPRARSSTAPFAHRASRTTAGVLLLGPKTGTKSGRPQAVRCVTALANLILNVFAISVSPDALLTTVRTLGGYSAAIVLRMRRMNISSSII